MSAHEGWQFLCRLFAAGTPVLRATLSPRGVALLPHLGRAIQAAVTDQSHVPCPHCALHRAPVFGDGGAGGCADTRTAGRCQPRRRTVRRYG